MHADLITLIKYWQSICPAGGGMPHRDDLSPAAIVKILPSIFLLERQGDGDMLVRLMGTELTTRLGGEMTGRSILEMMRPDSVEYYRGLYHGVLDAPAGALVVIESEVEGSEPIKIEFVHLPMRAGESSGDSDSPKLVLGAGAASHSKLWEVDLGGTFANLSQVVIEWIDIGFGPPDNEIGRAGKQVTLEDALAHN